jgi:hypothetical protein
MRRSSTTSSLLTGDKGEVVELFSLLGVAEDDLDGERDLSAANTEENGIGLGLVKNKLVSLSKLSGGAAATR